MAACMHYFLYCVGYADLKGNRHNLTLVQCISPSPDEVDIKPHENSKSSEPYFRTSESTRYCRS